MPTCRYRCGCSAGRPAIVLVVSFVALSALWTRPQLQSEHRKPLLQLPPARGGARRAWSGSPLFALVLYSGFAGTQVWSANFSVTFIYVIFWIGMPIASVLLGDVFAVLSPWRSCARAIRWARRAPGAEGLRAPAAALPGAARAVAGRGPARRLRLARARLRRTRQPVDARGAVARLLPGDARRHARLRGRGVGRRARTASAPTSDCSRGCRR